MKVRVVFPLLLLGLILGLGLTGVALRAGETAAPVYTVAQIRANMTRHSAAWANRTVRVRGTLQGPFIFCGATTPCPVAPMGLVDDGNGIIGSNQYLAVEQGRADGVWSFFRHIPLLGALMPAPQRLRFGLTGTYLLQLHPQPSSFCHHYAFVLCYKGVVLDAAPAMH